jgi:hypothetical protein
MDFPDQFCHWLPAEFLGNLGSNLKIYPRNKKMSTRLQQACQIAQALLRFLWPHVAQEPIRNHNILKTEHVRQFRISRIAAMPKESLAEL